MPTLFGRLKRLLPATLWREIVPGPCRRTYRLTLPSDHIFLAD
ncbi:MAG: hypothetical protein U0871_19890 [Gemmataceae bacterium]